MACSSILSEEDLCRFRTKPCIRRRRPHGCDFGPERCQYSHNSYWPRRCPYYVSKERALRYIPSLCPDVCYGAVNGGDDDDLVPLANQCPRGGACPFAHSSEEVRFHPLVYKTEICADFQSGTCTKYYCPRIHGLAERRIPGTLTLPFTQGAVIPPTPGVIVTAEDTRRALSSSGHPRMRQSGCWQPAFPESDSQASTRTWSALSGGSGSPSDFWTPSPPPLSAGDWWTNSTDRRIRPEASSCPRPVSPNEILCTPGSSLRPPPGLPESPPTESTPTYKVPDPALEDLLISVLSSLLESQQCEGVGRE